MNIHISHIYIWIHLHVYIYIYVCMHSWSHGSCLHPQTSKVHYLLYVVSNSLLNKFKMFIVSFSTERQSQKLLSDLVSGPHLKLRETADVSKLSAHQENQHIWRVNTMASHWKKDNDCINLIIGTRCATQTIATFGIKTQLHFHPFTI